MRHRVIGLVHDGLKRAAVDVPAETTKSISSAAQAQLSQNLAFAAEVVRLARAFESRGLRVTFFKGVPTAIELYGDLGMRHSKDIDLLVERGSMRDTGAVLESSGYGRIFPPPDVGDSRLNTLMRTGKDIVYRRKNDPTLEVELHWRLFNNAKFMDRLGAVPVTKTFPALANARLTVFSADDAFAYLCGHGAAFAWCRLKWLADIGALLAREAPNGILRLYEAAAERGAALPAAQAMMLCRRLFGSELPAVLAEKPSAKRRVQRLEQLALKAMTQGNEETEPSELRGGMRPIARSLWLLNASPRYLWGEFNSRWISADDVVSVALPSALQFMYPLLRVPLWLWRHAAARRAYPGQKIAP